MLVGPLALTSANRTGGVEVVNAREVLDAPGNDLDLVIVTAPVALASPLRWFASTATAMRFCGRAWSRKRPCSGFPARWSLFCTGNTCRSPMAELICRQMLAKRLGCEICQLEDRGCWSCYRSGG